MWEWWNVCFAIKEETMLAGSVLVSPVHILYSFHSLIFFPSEKCSVRPSMVSLVQKALLRWRICISADFASGGFHFWGQDQRIRIFVPLFSCLLGWCLSTGPLLQRTFGSNAITHSCDTPIENHMHHCAVLISFAKKKTMTTKSAILQAHVLFVHWRKLIPTWPMMIGVASRKDDTQIARIRTLALLLVHVYFARMGWMMA